jgi:CheY-like chemotaxis protein
MIAENGQDALKKLSGYHPDVIFLDLNMPLMNGRQFLEEIKKKDGLSHIPVIILSTSSDKSTIEDTRRLGARDFITKPDKLSAWEARLKEVFSNPALLS